MINDSTKTCCEISHITFEDALALVMDEVNRVLSASPSIVRTYTKHLAASRGKFIRAISLLACAQDQDDRIHPNAVKFAAAIEIFHLATLVHDDVIDDADIRRGVPTLQKQYGKKNAVICGDYLLCIALKLAVDIPDKQNYLSLNMPDYMTKVCFGELNEQINSGNFDLTVFRYLKIISGKTAALFEASFHGGAVLSEKSPDEIRKYCKLGRYVGMIFQLIDDCMDFEATIDVAKKPVRSDFGQNVITLPLIHAFVNLLGFKEKARKEGVTRKEVDDAVASTNGIPYTRMVAGKYYDKYIKTLNGMNITENKKKRLLTVLDKAYRIGRM